MLITTAIDEEECCTGSHKMRLWERPTSEDVELWLALTGETNGDILMETPTATWLEWPLWMWRTNNGRVRVSECGAAWTVVLGCNPTLWASTTQPITICVDEIPSDNAWDDMTRLMGKDPDFYDGPCRCKETCFCSSWESTKKSLIQLMINWMVADMWEHHSYYGHMITRIDEDDPEWLMMMANIWPRLTMAQRAWLLIQAGRRAFSVVITPVMDWWWVK